MGIASKFIMYCRWDLCSTILVTDVGDFDDVVLAIRQRVWKVMSCVL
jgi:hypothetical protein